MPERRAAGYGKWAKNPWDSPRSHPVRGAIPFAERCEARVLQRIQCLDADGAAFSIFSSHQRLTTLAERMFEYRIFDASIG
jgi:hypothetical protein